MPPQLHITRSGSPITHDEWSAALAGTPGVRLARNTPAPSDAELWDPKAQRWITLLNLTGGQVLLADDPAFHAVGHPVRDAVFHMATMLRARVLDDDGKPVSWSP